jgi:hypothetical protein
MALNKEIWINDIVEGFFPANEFVSRSLDHSMYVNNKTVHVPNAGLPPEIKKNISTFPVSASKRTDTDLTYDIDTFYSIPIHIQNSEVVELSYDKRQSVLAQMRAELQRVVMESVLASWLPASPNLLPTTGDAVASHIATATGNRKKLTINDIKTLKLMFDKQDIPSDGRYILLDSDMYNELMGEMTDAATLNFLAGANPESGVIGTFMGFNFYTRSKVLKTTAAGAYKDWSASGAATDSAAGLAWHQSSVARALGDVDMFDSQQDPLYYGDIMSCSMRAGGHCIRTDKKGVVLIYQATAE